MMIKRIIKQGLGKWGLEIKRINTSANLADTPFTINGALERCKKRGIEANTIIDIGASDGRWSQQCMRYFPDSNYFLIEAQSPHEDGLRKFKQVNPNADYIIAAAGKAKGKIFFDNSSLFGGVASGTPFKNNCIEVPVVSVDDEIKARGLPGPYLLKLDTHGFEIPIFEGAKNTISKAELIIVEVYNYKISEECLLYYQICDYLAKLGFLSIEAVGFMLRKYDSSFWQMDLFFIKSNSKEFSYPSYE